MILVENQYNSDIENMILSHHIELLHVRINLKASLPISFVSIYGAPSCSVNDFFQSIRNFLNNIDYLSHSLIMAGYININILQKKNVNTNEFLALLNDYGLSIINKEPTHISQCSSTLIDMIICNKLAERYINGLDTSAIGFSDHHSIICGYKKTNHSKRTCTIYY